MTIMLAGGMVIGAPSLVPEAAAAGALYVSAENALFDNHFGGINIVEVIVIGVADETDEEQGEPVVKINENQLRMAQAMDGNWYGYFADDTALAAIEVTAGGHYSQGIQIGVDSTPTVYKGDFSEATDVYSQTAAITATNSGMTLKNYPALSTWNSSSVDNKVANADVGQIGIAASAWPVIQTYDLRIDTFDVILEQAGANEVVTLNYDSADTDDFAGMTLDRNSASQESDIHLTITDQQLNIDPTGKDVVIFYVGDSSAPGVAWQNRTASSPSETAYVPFDNSFDDNGKLLITNNTNGGASILSNDATVDDGTADNLVIFYETAENSGIFVNTDDIDDSNIDVNVDAKRGFTATFDYNDSAQSFVVANDFGVITMDAASVGDEWNSGEALTVTLIDQDLNKNSYSDEDLTIQNTTRTHLIPTLTIGSPVSIDKHTGADGVLGNLKTNSTTYSKIAYYSNATAGLDVIGSTNPYVISSIFEGRDITSQDTVNTYLNYDVTSFVNGTNTVTMVRLVDSGNASVVTEADSVKGIVEITSPSTIADDDMKLEISTTSDGAALASKTIDALPVIVDVFSFGNSTNNAIYRILLEESGDNTATFEGTIEFTMLNQINVDLDATYTNLATIDSDIDIIVHEDLTDEDSPRVNFYDLGADGISTQIADQLEAPTHNGVVSFDLDNYKIGDTVVVTLDDQDMNADSELIDVYTTNIFDRVGNAGSTDLASGLVLDITFDDKTWINSDDDTDCAAETISGGSDGLEATGFTLVETGAESGLFVGSFQIPEQFCDGTNFVTVTGTDIEVNYQDYRNSSGESTEVGDGASLMQTPDLLLLIEQYIQSHTITMTLTYTQPQITLVQH
jgi:hypothetical protein